MRGGQLWGPDAFIAAHQGENLGFAKASNLGAHLASSSTLLFLNNDTELTANWLPPLLETLYGDERLGAVGPLLLFPGDSSVQHLGVTFYPPGNPGHLYEHFPATHPVVVKKRICKTITGAALCMRKSVFVHAGCFFEGYKNGFEDVDLCLFLNAQGYYFCCVPESIVYHHTSQTVGRFDHNYENSVLLKSRHLARLRPDIDRYARQDGYDIYINEDLCVLLCLPGERTAELCAWAKTHSPQDWFDMLEKEPLWKEGYDLLATYCEKNGNFEEAFSLRLEAFRFHSSRANYIQIFKTAKKAGARRIVEDIKREMRKIFLDPVLLRRQAIRCARWAKDFGEPFWEKKYLEWLEFFKK